MMGRSYFGAFVGVCTLGIVAMVVNIYLIEMYTKRRPTLKCCNTRVSTASWILTSGGEIPTTKTSTYEIPRARNVATAAAPARESLSNVTLRCKMVCGK